MTQIIIQARMESRRFPGKMLAPLLEQPMVLRLLDRLAQRFPREQIWIATPATVANVPLQELVARHGYQVAWPAVRPDDVLARYWALANDLRASAIVRITGDCPLLDPDVVQQAIELFQAAGAEYVALEKEWPDGLDVEVISREVLHIAHGESNSATDREHVTPFIWRQPERFREALLPCPYDLSVQRWSVDSSEDLKFVEALLVRTQWQFGVHFGWRDVYLTRQRCDWELKQLCSGYFAQEQARNADYMRQIAEEQGRAPDDETWEKVRYGHGTVHDAVSDHD